jgi:hypothetical protein
MRKRRGARDLEVAQMAKAVVSWIVLPGLLAERDTNTTKGPKEMVRRDLVEEVEEFGAAAVLFLDYYYVVRWTANHPHPEAAGVVAQPRQR